MGYVLFIVAVVYFLSLKAQRQEIVSLLEKPFKTLTGHIAGTISFKERPDRSQFVILKLEAPVPESLILLQTRDGLWREIGRMKGATFISTLPPDLHLERLKALRLVTLEEMVLAEVPLEGLSSPSQGQR